jgi:Zn-dependent protease with chaperone function
MSPSDAATDTGAADMLAAPVAYFDGRQSTAHPVRLVLKDGWLHILGEQPGEPPIALDHEARRLTWPERQRHGPRVMLLPGGAQLQCTDGPAWDHWAARHQLDRSLAVRLQQSWRGTAAAALLCLAVLGIGYTHGLPAAANAVLWALPASVDAQAGEAALDEIGTRWLAPSRVPEAQQARLRDALAQALQRQARITGEPVPAWQLHFHRSRDKVPGANAFALPGGAIVVTDELVELLKDREDVLLGVLAHEMGHVRHRHGMRQVVQSGLLGAIGGVLLGDVSSVLGSVPVLLGHLAYTRAFERQADDEAIALLQAADLSPAVMTVLFERLQAASRDQERDDGILSIAFASHPPDAERIARFKDAAAKTTGATTGNRN